MTTTVYAVQDDTLDSLVYRHFGATKGLVELTLDLNPALADSAMLSLGQAVILPDMADTSESISHVVQLWD